MRRAAEPMTKWPPWTRREKLTAVLFVGAVAIQFALPAWVLTAEPNRGDRFGWQMYAGAQFDVRYATRTADGRTHRINAPAEVGRFWGNVHYGPGTPRRLCDADPRRVTVIRYHVKRSGARSAEESFSCR